MTYREVSDNPRLASEWGVIVEAPFEYGGRGETCIGCGLIINAGDMVAPVSGDRPDRLLCTACWWLSACELPLPGWSRQKGRRTNLAGAFQTRRAANLRFRLT